MSSALMSGFDPAGCAWEWGGVVEADPQPCADPFQGRIAGAGVATVGFGAVVAILALALLVVIAVRLRG